MYNHRLITYSRISVAISNIIAPTSEFHSSDHQSLSPTPSYGKLIQNSSSITMEDTIRNSALTCQCLFVDRFICHNGAFRVHFHRPKRRSRGVGVVHDGGYGLGADRN